VNLSDDIALIPWAPNERENFFDAINRYQRSTWRVTAACAAASLVVFMVFPVLLIPLICSAAVLLFDVLNRFFPVPDLAPKVLPLLNLVFELLSSAVKVFDSKDEGLGTVGSFFGLHGEAAKRLATLSFSQTLSSLALALLPSMVLLALAGAAVNRALKLSPLFDADLSLGRPLNASNLTELRIRNTMEEMAIAASLPAPRVVIIDGGKNAAAVGADSRHSTVLIGTALLESLNREQIQACASMLVASIANGDLAIGRQTALTQGLFALIGRTSTGLLDRKTAQRTLKLIFAVLFPTKANATYILTELAEPLDNDSANQMTAVPEGNRVMSLLKGLLSLLLFPLVLGGLVVGLLSSVGLSSGMAYLWRQRKYMTDATAVRLTRNPDALVSALDAAASGAGQLQEAAWASHMHILGPGAGDKTSVVANSAISFPSADARQKALVTMGAKNIGLQKYQLATKDLLLMSFAGVLLLFAVFLLCVAVIGMMGMALIASAAISGLPVYVAHLFLR
jgi:Zn-dependent protease with chaperone function